MEMYEAFQNWQVVVTGLLFVIVLEIGMVASFVYDIGRKIHKD